MYRWQENKLKEKNNESGRMRKEENKVRAKKNLLLERAVLIGQ